MLLLCRRLLPPGAHAHKARLGTAQYPARRTVITEADKEEAENKPLLVVSLSTLLSATTSALATLHAEAGDMIVFGNHPKQDIKKLIMAKSLLTPGLPAWADHQLYGNACVPVYSPNAGYLMYIIEAARGDLGNSIVLSGSPGDILMAKTSGVPCIAVAGPAGAVVAGSADPGEGDAAVLGKCHPDLLIVSLEEVPEALVKLKDSSMY